MVSNKCLACGFVMLLSALIEAALFLAFMKRSNRSVAQLLEAKPESINQAIATTAVDAFASAADAFNSDVRGFRILYAIRTSIKNYEKKLPNLLRTWASTLPDKRDLVIFGTQAHNVTMGPGASFEVWGTDCADNRFLGLSCVEAHIHLYARQLKESWNWLFVIDEDVFVMTRNLEKVLSKKDEHDPKIYAYGGCVSKCRPNPAVNKTTRGLCGGGGYAISKHNLYKVVDEPATYKKEFMTQIDADKFCDVVVGCLAERHGIQIANLPGLYPWKQKPADFDKAMKSKSPLPLSFHYTTPDEMLQFGEKVEPESKNNKNSKKSLKR